jgi:hypothetical protein
MADIFVMLCAYNAYASIRWDLSLAEIAIDSVEELGRACSSLSWCSCSRDVSAAIRQ